MVFLYTQSNSLCCCIFLGSFLVVSIPVTVSFSTSLTSKLPRRGLRTALNSQHEFWGSVRSSDEIVLFVESCLEDFQSNHCNQKVQVISAEPPLLVIHNFLPPEMCSDLINTAIKANRMKESTVGEGFTKSNNRTSSTTWLTDEDCEESSRLIAEKLSLICGLPPSYMENLQIVKYLPGQEFALHTDHQASFNDVACRGRLATCLLYLDGPDCGGETWFPGIHRSDFLGSIEESDTKIIPSTGSAVFFWNTVEKPGSDGYFPTMDLQPDFTLRHAGLPVVDGTKWVCNRWVHPIEYGAGVQGLRETSAE